MTFSVVARCPDSGMLGVAVSSSSPAVAARCAFARAGVGAVSTQNVTDPRLGPRLLDLIALGASAPDAVEVVAKSAAHIEHRQILAVDGAGSTGVRSGSRTLGVWSEAQATDVACAGNLLDGEGVPAAMVDAFLASPGHLGERLVATLRAGLAAGGEAGPVRSAGLLLVHEVSWPVADLRVDWTTGGRCPIEELAALWAVYQPQLEDYVTRALDPDAAPGYGVPGDPAP